MMYAHITLLSDKGYRPLSHRVEVKDIADYKQNKAAYQEKGVLWICKNKGITIRHLMQYGYSKITVRFEVKEGQYNENVCLYVRG